MKIFKFAGIRTLRKILSNLKFLVKPSKDGGYSQSEEDLKIVKWFPEKTGSYLDIGAGDPILGSNTYLFYRMGWRGILVEPLSLNVRMLKLFRPRDQVCNVVIGSFSNSTLWEFYPSQYSTTVEKVALDLINAKKIFYVGKFSRDVKRISDFDCRAKPEDPFFLTIDVEGAEIEVLKTIDWKKFLPRLICVEDWPGEANQNKDETNHFLTKLGYLRVDRSELSNIYIHTEYLKNINEV